jgi:zinc-binding alcohol dehydrogenase/oxidoreductase
MLNRSRLKAGETALIVGVGSGVSSAALAIAKWMGASVIVTSRDETKRVQAIEMGADAAVDTSADKWNVEADVVIESVGPATWEKSMRSLAPGGRMVVCGGTSGPKAEINIPRLFFKQYEIIGSSMGSYEEFDQLLSLVEQGLPIAIDSVHALSDYETALGKLERGDQLGKIVLRHGGAQ